MAFTRAPESRPTPPQIYNIRIYILTILSCLGSWMFGYNNGIIAGVLVLPSFYHDFHLPPLNTSAYDNTVANIVSLFQIGGLVGSVATFPCMKYWGRKMCLAGAGFIYAVGAVLQVRALSTEE
jgi:MFS family permease